MENYLGLIDIGGTYTKLKIIHFKKSNYKVILEKKEKIKEKDKLFKFLIQNLKKIKNLNSLVLCIAGPVFKDSGFMTNWEKKPSISIMEIKRILRIKKVYLLNDLQAQGFGLLSLKKKDSLHKNSIQIKGPEIKKNFENIALVIPGTGLGTCGIIKDHFVIPMELQHSPFYPQKENLLKIFKSFLEKKIFPSYENFVSGEGLLNIYKSIKNIKSLENIRDPGGYVKKKAKAGEKEAIEAIKLYFLVLALYCQTLALAIKPLKGIFFGGKAIKRNFEFFPQKEFIEIFINHPKQEKLLKKIPIYFIKKDLIFEGLLYFYKLNEKS